MRRISVVGNSGSGKTSLSRQLANRLGVPYLELDGIFHLPGWRELPIEDFRRQVGEFVGRDAWVVDGNYSAVRDLVWARADTVIWLDLPRPVVMRQVIGRTLARVIRRTELWNGNREPWTNLWSRDPQRSILAWAWTQHAAYRQRYGAAMRDPAFRHLTWVVLHNPSDIEALVRGGRQSTTAW